LVYGRTTSFQRAPGMGHLFSVASGATPVIVSVAVLLIFLYIYFFNIC